VSQTATESFVMIGVEHVVEHVTAGTGVARCGARTTFAHRGEVVLFMIRPELPG
jgi:hypothetical protein